MLEYSIFLFFPFFMIYAAISDLLTMTISNKVSVLLISGFMIFAYSTGMDFETVLWHWAMFATVLLVGFTLFAFGVVGGGDAKLAAVTGLWLGWDHILEYFTISALLGALLTIMILKFRSQVLPDRLADIEWVARLYRADNGVPYGIALGAGAILVYPGTLWMQYALSMAAL